jgi:hypothetical protein
MERVVRWVDIDSCQPGRNTGDPAWSWEGATLRPTGVIVFATLDRTRGRFDTAPARKPGCRRAGGWRVGAQRSVAWLLGR